MASAITIIWTALWASSCICLTNAQRPADAQAFVPVQLQRTRPSRRASMADPQFVQDVRVEMSRPYGSSSKRANAFQILPGVSQRESQSTAPFSFQGSAERAGDHASESSRSADDNTRTLCRGTTAAQYS